MDFQKSIRVLDPFGGWGPHNLYRERTHNKLLTLNNDTGFCNRIFHWEVVYDINEKNNNEYQIMVLGSEWPETDLLDIPYTSAMQFNNHVMGHDLIYEAEKVYFQHRIDYSEQKLIKIDKFDITELLDLYRTRDFNLSKDHYVFDTGYQTLRELYRQNNPKFHTQAPLFDENERPLQKIKLKHQFINDIIKNECENFVGIHLRRFNGIQLTQDQLSTFPKNIREMYESIQYNKDVESGPIKFYEDQLYFEIIDKILEINPQQRFYIAQDLPEDFLEHFFERYDTKIMTKRYFVNIFKKYLLDSNVDIVKLENYGNVLENIVDLFCLSYTKFLVSTPKSSYSEFAKTYIPKPHIDINKDIDDIIDLYKFSILENSYTINNDNNSVTTQNNSTII